MLHNFVKRFRSSNKRKCREMAGVAEKIQVVSSESKSAVFDGELSPTDLTFKLSADTSLQELIDSELALRLTAPPEVSHETPDPELPRTEPRARPVQPVSLALDVDPSERLIAAERTHTAATLNVFSTTIDLSPDCEPPSPLFPRSPVHEFATDPFPDTFTKPFQEDSPPSDGLEPMPLFTQTISSDHEQSPLTEEPPGFREEVLVVIDPPDDPTPTSVTDSPEMISPPALDSEFPDFPDDKVPEKVASPEATKYVPVNDGTEPISPQANEIHIPEDFPETVAEPLTDLESIETVIEQTQTDLESIETVVEQSQTDVESIETVVEQTQHEQKPINTVVEPTQPERSAVETIPEPIPDHSPCASDALVDIVDNRVANSMCEFGVVNAGPAWGEEWTTVGEAVKEVQSCEATEEFDRQPPDHLELEELPPSPAPAPTQAPLHVASDTESDFDSNVSETTTSTTKTVKKKKSTEGGDSTSTKTKKTKKTKKSEEKENHISVITNGHNGHNGHLSSDSERDVDMRPEAEANELSNVCVRDLKQSYCREAAKCTSVTLKVPSEEPVPSPVSIRELRRSFCDLKQACERERPIELVATLPPPIITPQLKARSLGDLRRLSDSPHHRHVHTGVSVKALAASYWNLVSNEPTTPPISLTPPPNRNVAHTLKKSSFSKFDQLQKKSVLHVRSSDASKIQKQLNQEAPEAQGANPTCKSCGKTVFAMEQVKAERSVWHKNCFRCKECSKQLTGDIYQSHEGELYCKPHFRELFKPKAVLDNGDDEPLRRRKPEMIIRENQPMELPPEVVRASDKADLGLEELSSLNVKSKFQVFEKSTTEAEVERSPSTVNVKRSSSILSKLVKFQKKGMDIGVSDDILNGADYEESSSSEDEAQATEEDDAVVKSSKKTEKPISFNKMEDVKKTWETSGSTKTKEELRAEHKKEISQIRSRLFQGKQGKMKEMYEQAVADSEGKVCKKDQDIVQSEKARLLKERFERGEVTHSDEEDDKKNKDSEDMSVFEAGISKKSRSIFLELDATAAKTQISPVTPPVHALTPRTTERCTSQTVSRQVSEDIIRASDPSEDVVVPTADVSDKFKFFETYKAPEKERKAFRFTPPREGQVKEDSPDREIYRDPTVVRSEDTVEEETIVKRSQTASKMLSLFRQMEEQKETVPDGPKPLKCFTPPPDHKEDHSGSSEEEEDEEESEEEEESEDDTGIVKASDKIEDEFLKQARNAARSKALKDKFEHWEPEKQSVNNAINLLDSEQESIESTKSLRARFESLKAEQPKEKARPKVNRFVVCQMQEAVASPNKCVSCDKTVYPLEKVEVNGKQYHALCFKCQQCNCKLRMDTYTLNNETLYCLTHFRQLFIAKGNYDEGFGNNQHKRKWESPTSPSSPTSPTSPATAITNGHH